jgi:hypothetical protein
MNTGPTLLIRHPNLYYFLSVEAKFVMTYENAENGRRKNCRKWKMTSKAKM